VVAATQKTGAVGAMAFTRGVSMNFRDERGGFVSKTDVGAYQAMVSWP
jgi:hypothetical protein